MADPVDRSPTPTTRKLYYAAQICLRALAIVVTFAAALRMVTNNQTAVIYGIEAESRYSYAPAFKFLVVANFFAFVFSVVSLILVFVLGKKALGPTHFYVFFLHDLMVTLLLMATCGAATAVALVGKYGNDHVGWVPVCEHFEKFCNRVQTALILTFLGFFLYLGLSLVSAKKLLHVGAASL